MHSLRIFSTLFIVLCFSYHSIAQLTEEARKMAIDQDTLTVAVPQKKLRVGYFLETPYVVRKGDQVDGLSVMLWERVAAELDLSYEYKTYKQADSLKKAIKRKDIDVAINPIIVSAADFTEMEFTQPVLISNLAIAARADQKSLFLELISRIFNWEFLAGVIAMGFIILLFGFLAWLFERKANADQFPNTPKGLWDSFWWSAVTMTTVGYGDKAPKTIGGRLIAVAWMFTAVIIVASYTATISSSLTIGNFSVEINSLEDLHSASILADAQSQAQTYLKRHGVNSRQIDDPQKALDMVVNNQADAFVADEIMLRYLFHKGDYEDKLLIAPGKYLKQNYAFGLAKDSQFERPINMALIKILKSPDWLLESTEYLDD